MRQRIPIDGHVFQSKDGKKGENFMTGHNLTLMITPPSSSTSLYCKCKKPHSRAKLKKKNLSSKLNEILPLWLNARPLVHPVQLGDANGSTVKTLLLPPDVYMRHASSSRTHLSPSCWSPLYRAIDKLRLILAGPDESLTLQGQQKNPKQANTLEETNHVLRIH